MPWQTGQSGNPSGRPRKGSALADMLQSILDEPWKEGGTTTKRERLCRLMVASACEGNMKAVNWVADRAEGRAVAAGQSGYADTPGTIRLLDYEDPLLTTEV